MISEKTIQHFRAQRDLYAYRIGQTMTPEWAELFGLYVDFYNGLLDDAFAVWTGQRQRFPVARLANDDLRLGARHSRKSRKR
jgi:hypothetical protein